MKTLIIVANPREDSFSFAIANKFKELAIAQKFEVDVIDLYKTEYQQAFYTFKDFTNVEPTAEMKYFQGKISEANELVFVFPYWWGSMPAILKNFIAWNFSRGFAFSYKNSKAEGLLTGKTVKIFTTTRAPSSYYNINGANNRLKKMLQKQFVEFCGMKLESCNIYGGVGKSKTNTADILNSIRL